MARDGQQRSIGTADGVDGAAGAAADATFRIGGKGGDGSAGAGGAGGSISDTAGDAGVSAAGGANGGDWGADAGNGSGTGQAGAVAIGTVKARQVDLGRPGSDTVRSGSIRVPVTATAISLLLSKDHEIIAATAGAGGITITLPTAVGIAGRRYTIKKVDSGAGVVTIDADGAQTIDGALTLGLTAQWDWVTIVSDGAGWLVIA